MYTVVDLRPEVEEFALKRREVLEKLLAELEPAQRGIRVPVDQTLFENWGERGHFYVIQEGTLRCRFQERVLFYAEEGDILGVEEYFGIDMFKVDSDFSIVVDEYHGETFLRQVASDPQRAKSWSEYLVLTTGFLQGVITAKIRGDAVISPEIKTYAPGQVIIEQNSWGNEVSTLIEGHADVFVDDVKVGEIFRDEIFGAIAALTGSFRSATVVAGGPCLVATIPRDHFLCLMEERPQTVFKVVQDMARTITSLNQRVVEMTKEKEKKA